MLDCVWHISVQESCAMSLLQCDLLIDLILGGHLVLMGLNGLLRLIV